LKAKYIIHAVTCQKGSKTNQDILRKATRNCLAKTKDKDIETVALPALGCGAAGFAYEKAAKIMIEEVLSFCQNNNNLKEIIFVLNDKKSYRIFKDVIRERFDKVKKKIQQHPIPTVDIIIEKEGKVILIERKNPPFGWAIPGGFVELDESVETSAQREAEEETGIKVKNLKQFRVYSEPGRDPRFHTISCVFTAQSDSEPKASTDAKKAEFFTKFNLPDNIVFDHRKILKDYFDSRNKE
jgi:ADP-ribose pyrophosphatase YjhB (NUDIX family)